VGDRNFQHQLENSEVSMVVLVFIDVKMSICVYSKSDCFKSVNAFVSSAYSQDRQPPRRSCRLEPFVALFWANLFMF